eukprot:6485806-Amphidinium_carterae.1
MCIRDRISTYHIQPGSAEHSPRTIAQHLGVPCIGGHHADTRGAIVGRCLANRASLLLVPCTTLPFGSTQLCPTPHWE